MWLVALASGGARRVLMLSSVSVTADFPALIALGPVPQNSQSAQRPLCSNSCGKHEHDAR